MGEFATLTKKSIDTLKSDGIKTFVKKAQGYIKRRNVPAEITGQVYMDVLFINGCYLPHPSRYRVTHQREQLLAFNITSNEVIYEKLTLNLVKQYRLFIFYRCPYTETIGEFIRIAKAHNKTVLYDIDDLVIDEKYTSLNKYVQQMSPEDRRLYDDGVNRMRQTLLLCDGAITTTERLAQELMNYVPKVFINRNVASDRMLQLSMFATYNRDVLPYFPPDKKLSREQRRALAEEKQRIESGKIRIGYFSGSITHNADIEMIMPVLHNIMEKHENVELHFVGEMVVPDELKQFESRIVAKKFVPWQKLPGLIASVDINIAPLEDNIFNEAKSENKWVEAALVKVPTVASRFGAFERMIEDGKTGLLCDSMEEWERNIEKLIVDKEYRTELAENAFKFVRKNAITIETGRSLAEYLRSQMSPNLLICLPSAQISGGVLVALKHCSMLSKAGVDVTILNDGAEVEDIELDGQSLFVLSHQYVKILGRIDKAVATLWSTFNFMVLYPNIVDRYYLVQGYEVDFLDPGRYLRIPAVQSYVSPVPTHYITISKWCVEWLKEKFGQEARYARNGIDLRYFPVRERNLSGKVRIIIEGKPEDKNKNADESFRIVEKLDRDKFEVWYMAYEGKPKDWYRVDRFFQKVPNTEVGKIYNQCDILIKSSLQESFSYPPLEMMATGGFCVVAPNGGNAEYLRHEENCLLYKQGDIDSGVRAIERICHDADLRKKLYANGLATAQSRAWEKLEEEILSLYDM